eukprot:767929-Hanusia_phi.AAC.2
MTTSCGSTSPPRALSLPSSCPRSRPSAARRSMRSSRSRPRSSRFLSSSWEGEIDKFDQVVPLEKAMSIKALRAVFGEQYPDPVRVLAVGGDIDAMVSYCRRGGRAGGGR